MKILLTNDDGVGTKGLAILKQWAQNHGHSVRVVAPSTNQSGRSMAITLERSLSVVSYDTDVWAVDGTPADCMRIALAFLSSQPDLVLSGINHGWNVGHEVHMSGTVGAARMAALRGIPSVALSAPEDATWETIGELLEIHGQRVMASALSSHPGEVISINFPRHGGKTASWATLAEPSSRDVVQWAKYDDGVHQVHLSFGVQDSETDTLSDRFLLLQGHTTFSCLPSTNVVPSALHSSMSAPI